jgi:hypothetical protein
MPNQDQDSFRQRVIDALPKLDKIAQDGIRADQVPGVAIAVVLQDEVVYAKGFGVRKAGENAAVDPDTVFQLASFSKPISSTVVAALVSDGALKWDTRIADADPGFRLHDAYPSAEVTIRDLFAHRSGLPGLAGDDLEEQGMEQGFSRDEILRRIGYLEPSSSFRAGYDYSNFGLTEGGLPPPGPLAFPWRTRPTPSSSNHSVWLRPARVTPTSSARATGRRYTSKVTRAGKRGSHEMLTHSRPPGGQLQHP